MKKILIWTVAVLAALQLIPVNRDNPVSDPSLALQAEGEVGALLRSSCYDCHSNETRWPAYAYVAPVSFVIASHVHNARKALNFSEYRAIAPDVREARLKRAVMTVNNGRMALPSYRFAHENAELTEAQRKLLTGWFEAELERTRAH